LKHEYIHEYDFTAFTEARCKEAEAFAKYCLLSE